MSSEKGAAERRGAFNSTMEVWLGGWRAVTVGGSPLRSLLGLILSATAGGTDRVGGRWRRRRGNQWSCWRPSSHSARCRHSHSSQGFLRLFMPQRDPVFPFLSALHIPVCLHSALLYNIFDMKQVGLGKA